MHTYGQKMARNGRTKDIYKGPFICIQTLVEYILNYADFETLLTFHEGTVYALELDFLIEFCSEYLLKMQVSKICECRFRKNFNLM